jgi:hypothetical protein
VPDGYSRSPKLIKGALVSLGEPFLGPVPNVIVFQYNPESFERTITPWSPPSSSGTADGESPTDPTAQPFDPSESFTLTLELDATDALEQPDTHPVAVLFGVADRISAIEALLYPGDQSAVGAALSGLFGSGDVAQRSSVPVLLFVWGPGRILPVRITSYKVQEQAFSPTLYPLRATVTLGLTVVTAEAFEKADKKLSASEEIAVAAYKFTMGQRDVLARANLANSVESILGMLPI